MAKDNTYFTYLRRTVMGTGFLLSLYSTLSLRSGPNPSTTMLTLFLGQELYYEYTGTERSYPKRVGLQLFNVAFSFIALPLRVYPVTSNVAQMIGNLLDHLPSWPFTSGFSNPGLSYCFSSLKSNLSNYPLGTIIAGAFAVKTAQFWYDTIKLINEPQAAIDAREVGKTDPQKDSANSLRAFLQANTLIVYGVAITTTAIVTGVGLFAQTREHNTMLAVLPALSYLATSNITHYLEYKPGNTITVSAAKMVKGIADSITTSVGAYLG